jgi:hypothetical protein
LLCPYPRITSSRDEKEDIVGEESVEVVRDDERSGGQAERAGAGPGARDGPQLGDGADDDEVFAGLDPGE